MNDNRQHFSKFRREMKKEIMKISVILAFLLCWNFVSSNPHREKLNDKSVNELNNINDASDTLNLARKESSDEASSGKDWGGIFLNLLTFLNQKDLTDENDQADNKSLLDKFISQGSKFIENLTSKDLSDIPLLGNIITWVQENVGALGKLFTDKKTEKLNDRAKRDLGTSTLELLWAKPYKGEISEHLLKLSEGSTSNVLRSEKATVAEALNGRAAIRKILAQAKAKAAKAAQHKNLFDNDDFSKWFLSGSAFDTDIFNHPFHRSSYNAKITKHSAAENTDSSNHNTFSVLHRASKPANRHEIKHAFNALSDPTTVDTAVTERSYTKLLHKPGHQKHLSSKLQITSEEERGHETNGMFHKPVVSPRTHGSLSHKDEENTELRYASSHAHAPHMHLRVTEDEETGNRDVPKWRHVKWTYADSPRVRAPHFSHSAESDEFGTSDEMEEYKKRFIFKTLFGPGEEDEDERIQTKYRKKYKFSDMDIDEIDLDDLDDEELIAALNSYKRTKLGHKRYYGVGDRERYDEDFDNIKNRHSAGESPLEHDSLINSYREENIRNKNKHNLDGVQRSAIYSTKSNTEKTIEERQSRDMLISKISTDTPTMKSMNTDIEHYHSRDQSAAANSAMSFSSSLSDKKVSKHTNVLASASVDDGSAAVKMKTENDGVLGRTHSVIDNDATSAEIEMGFNGIKSHPLVDLPLAHSSLSHAHSKIHMGNEKFHHSISGYQHSTTNTAASSEAMVEAKMSMESRNKNQDLKENQVDSANAASSAEATTSIENERQRSLLSTVSLDDSCEEDYMRAREKLTDLKGMNYRNAAGHKTSIEVIDIDDRSAEVLIPEIRKFGKGKKYVSRVNFYDLNDQKMRDDKIIEANESTEDLKKSEINNDGLEKEEEEEEQEQEEKEKNIDPGISEELNSKNRMIISNEHGSYGRHSQRRKSNKHDRHNHRHSKHNYHKDHSQHNSTRNQYSQRNRHAFNQYARDTISSSMNATEFETWKKYLYFIRKRERENDESKASPESSASLVKKTTQQKNAMVEETSSLDRGGKKHITDEDNHVHLKKYKNIRGPVAHSMEINKIISTKNNREREIKNEDVMNNQSKNRETVIRTESLISDDSTIHTASHTHRNKKTSNNNNHRKQISMETMLSKNSRADVQTKTKRVYDTHGKNENVDINAKQTVETVQSTDAESLQHASWKTSMSEKQNEQNKIITGEQVSNEKIFSSSTMNGCQNHNDLQKTSTSSRSIAKSQAQTDHSNEKSGSSHEINTNVETLTGTILSSDVMTKSHSNVQNSITSSKSSEGLQSASQYDWSNLENNEKYNTNSETSIDSIVKNKQESISENTLFTSAKSEAEIENYSDNLKNTQMSVVNSGAISGAVTKSSVESEMRAKQKSDNFKNIQINNNVEISSKAMSGKNEHSFSSSEEFKKKINYHLVNCKDSQINAISKTSAETILSNTMKDEDRSDLQKSFSSSSAMSSEKLQEKSEHNSNNLRNSQTNISAAESSMKSTSISNTENEYFSDSSKSSSSKSLEETHVENKQYSDDMKINRKKNIGIITKIGIASPDNVKNHRQQESISSSLSSSHAKSQMENKNIKMSIKKISNNVISNMNQHNLLLTLSSSQNTDNNDLNYQQYDSQTADDVATLTASTFINDDNHGHGDNILKAKWLTDSTNENNNEKSDNNKNIKKSEFIKQDSKDASSTATSVKTMTSTDIKNIQNIMKTINSKTETWRHKYYLNHLKEGKSIIDNSIIGTSSKIGNNHENKLRTSSGSYNISKENQKNINIVQNNQESTATASSESIVSTNDRKSQDRLKETLSTSFTKTQEKQNNLNMSREKSEDIINKMIMNTSNSVNNVYRDNLLKDTLAVSNEKMQIDDKLNDKTKVSAANSIIKNEINSRVRVKDSKNVNNVNKIVSTTFNSFNNENQNNILNMTSSNDLLDANEISNTNVQNKDLYEIMSSVNAKTQSIYHKSGISKNKEIIKSNTHNSNEWHTKFHTTESSSSCAESQNKRKNAMKTTVSAESIANSINEDIRSYDLMQNKFLSDPANDAQADKEHSYYNQKVEGDNTKASAEISSSSISQIKHKYDAKKETSIASQSQQHDLNVQKEDKAITSNMLLSTEGTNSSDMRNARQELLERVTSSNSRTEMQHERISDIVKESSEITASAAMSAQTMFAEKIENESEEKLIKDSAKSNSREKSQVMSNVDSNISKEGKIIGSIETSANSAASNNFKHIRQNKIVEKNSLFHPGRDTYMENRNRNVPINNLRNAADTTVSAKETSSSIIRSEHQSDATKTTSTSHAEAQTEHEYNSSLERQSIEMISFGDVKNQAESKNIVNNMEKDLKAANTVISTNAMSSSSVENINKHDASEISSSSNSYVKLRNKINTHMKNLARGNQESTIAQSSATSLESTENQGKREDSFIRKILQPNSQNHRITKIENHNDNILKKNLHNSEDTVVSEAISFGNIKNEHQDNLLKATSLINEDIKSVQKDESSSFKNQHLITIDSMASSNSKISDYINNIDKNDLKELTATSSGNSYGKFSVQNKNDINILRKDYTDVSANTLAQAMVSNEFKDVQRDKSLQMTSSNSYAETQTKAKNTNNIKKDSNIIINAKTKTISNNVKDVGLHGLFDLLANSALKIKTERKNIPREDMIKENLSQTSSDLFSESQINNAHNSRILEKDHENSVMINTITKTKSNQRDQQNYLHKTKSSSTQNSQHNIKSNSYVTSQVTSEDIAKSERSKEDEEVTVNLSSVGKAYNKVKGTHSYDWLVTTSGATLAEERTQNKDMFNVLGEAEEAAVYAEAAVSNGIESKHRDIHAEDPRDCQDNWNAAKNIQVAVAVSNTSTEAALKETKDKNESKNILENKMTTLASNDAEILIDDREKCGVSGNLKSSANTEEMLHSTTSAISSVSASTSDNTNVSLKKIYNKINDETSPTPTNSLILKNNTEGEEHLSLVETSLYPPDGTNRCNEDDETKEFISEVTSLYKMLDKQRNSEILLMKKNPEGPVQIANLKHSVSPLITYGLIPREVYERTRTIIENKQIFCIDCPLSNS